LFLELMFLEPPPDWVQANEACSRPIWAEEFERPSIEDAREFVTIGTRVSGSEWHYQGTMIACEYTGQVTVDDEIYRFRAHPTGTGWVWRDRDRWESAVLCYECAGWHAVPDASATGH
jgi:hypothetical protein